MTATQDLLDFATAQHALPSRTRADAERLLGDTLAGGAAAVGAPGEPEILATARLMGSGTEARLIGTQEHLPAPGAAFVNGYRIHCLEWDAVHEPAVVHAMSVVVAALHAAIDRQGGCDPEKALVAMAVGVDIASGLGLSVDSGLTFFRPATAGIIGAALAVSRLTGAPADNALGLAYSSAAGTMQAHVEGSPTLPFQVANAARGAIVAADLAKEGFSAPKDVLEGPFGYYTLFDKGDLSRYTQDLGAKWRISEISVKPYPSGRASHAALGTLVDIRDSLRRQGSQEGGAETTEAPAFAGVQDHSHVTSIELACPPLIRRLVGRPYHGTMTPAYARLCLQWLSALMITDGRIDPRRFTPEDMADPDLAALASKFSLVPDGNEDPNALFPQELRVRFADGREDIHPIAHTLGSVENPLTGDKAAAKYALARELAPASADPRIFDDPLSYFTEPQ